MTPRNAYPGADPEIPVQKSRNGADRRSDVNADKLLGMRIRQRLNEYGIHYREYPGRGSDPEPHRIHWIPPPGNDTFETCFMFPVTEDSRRSKRALLSPLLPYSAAKKPPLHGRWTRSRARSNGEGMALEIVHQHA